MRLIMVLLVVSMLTGCATTALQGRVTRFHALDSTARTYVIVPDDGKDGSLEFRFYADLLKQELNAHGWHEAAFEEADIAVFLQYQIGQGREVAFSYPILGSVPSGISTTTGTVSTYGNTSTINATTTQGSTLGVVGTGVGSSTVFDRAVKVTMMSLPPYRTDQALKTVYEGEIRSTGRTGDLPTVMPALLEGLFKDFPGTSGKATDVAIPIK